MTEAQLPYDVASWPLEIPDLHMGLSRELGPYPFIASDLPLTIEEELDSSWTREQLNLVEDRHIKSTATQPYPQSWYDFGLVRRANEGMNMDSTSQSTRPQTAVNPPIRAPADHQLAAQRALFMTPSPYTSALPYPGSPASDPHASPEPSLASSRGWDWDGCDDARYASFDLGASNLNIPFHDQTQHHGNITSHRQYPSTNDDECFTPLEMPDGSTRLTSNWLPVSPDAGFTIGSVLPTDGSPDALCSAMMDQEVAAFQDMKHAFFPPCPASWSYDR